MVASKKRAKRVRAKRMRAKQQEPQVINMPIPRASKPGEPLAPVELNDLLQRQLEVLKPQIQDLLKTNIETMRDLISAHETLTEYRRTILTNMQNAFEARSFGEFDFCYWDYAVGWQWKEGYRPGYLDAEELREADRVIKKYVRKAGIPEEAKKPRRRRRTREEMGADERAGKKVRNRARRVKTVSVQPADQETKEQETGESEIPTLSFNG